MYERSNILILEKQVTYEEKYIALRLHTGNYDFIRLREVRYCLA